MTELNRCVTGDCREVLRQMIAEGVKVQCVVTSPPYWRLRDYNTATWEGGDGSECEHRGPPKASDKSTLKNDGRPAERVGQNAYERGATVPYPHSCPKCGAVRVDSQIGLERTPEEFVATMVEVFRLVREVLADDGTLFLNMGDSYFAGHGQRAGPYGTSGKVPANSQARGCLCGSLCDACRTAYQIGKSGSDSQRDPTLIVSPSAPSRERKASAFGRFPTSGSSRRASRTEAANLDPSPELRRAGAGPRASLAAKPRESSLQLQGECSETANRGECQLCGCSLVDCAPVSERMASCTCGTSVTASSLVGRNQGSNRNADPYPYSTTAYLKPKDLCGIPWRVAFALQAPYIKPHCVKSEIDRACKSTRAVRGNGPVPQEYQEKRALLKDLIHRCNQRQQIDLPAWVVEPKQEVEPGWYLRSAITLCKGNPMPESATDRPTKATEMMFLLAKQPRYYYDNEAVRVAGRHNLWDWWQVNSEPFKAAHFATFGRKWIEPCILAGTSERGHCPGCGARAVRVVEKSGGTIGKSWHDHGDDLGKGMSQGGKRELEKSGGKYRVEALGFRPTCSCNLDPVPDVVLDPFLGSGTVAQVAQNLGRNWLGIDLQKEYQSFVEARTKQQAMVL